MELQVTTITPDVAKNMLAFNTHNRPLKRNIVDLYAKAMLRGEWILNGSTISFDSNGRLTDGQHRLEAVVKSGVPIQCIVISGLGNDAFMTIDGGKKRTLPDILSINGEVSANQLAAGVRAYVRITRGPQAVKDLSIKLATEVVEHHPYIRYWSGRFTSARQARNLFPASIIGVLARASEVYSSEICEVFFDRISSGLNLTETDPAYVLRERFAAQSSVSRLRHDIALAFMVKAVKAHCTGQRMKILRMTPSESFPEL